MGLVTPLGCGVKPTWDNLVAAKSGLRNIQSFDVSDLPAKVAGGCSTLMIGLHPRISARWTTSSSLH
jgi:3-oxoacyl-(acyl-carrier-protein) synthase